MTNSDAMQVNYNDGIHDGMQVNEDPGPREIREQPMLSVDNRQMGLAPGPSRPWAVVPRRPQPERLVGGLRLPTAIWICVSGLLAVLAICIGAVLGWELQKSRKLQYTITPPPQMCLCLTRIHVVLHKLLPRLTDP